jgi:hypothetical protein
MRIFGIDHHLNLTVADFDETADGIAASSASRSSRKSAMPRGALGSAAERRSCCGVQHLSADGRRAEGLHRVNHFGLHHRPQGGGDDGARGRRAGYGGPVRWPHSTAWYVTDPTGWEIEVALWDGGEVRFT